MLQMPAAMARSHYFLSGKQKILSFRVVNWRKDGSDHAINHVAKLERLVFDMGRARPADLPITSGWPTIRKQFVNARPPQDHSRRGLVIAKFSRGTRISIDRRCFHVDA